MKNKAIIGETPEVYFIDNDILQYLNYTYLTVENSVLVGVGFKFI